MKVKILLTVLTLAVAIGWGVRVYNVNAGVAKKYEIGIFQVGEEVTLDNVVFKVSAINYGDVETIEEFQFVPAIIEIQVQNISNENIQIGKIIESKLAYGMDYYQTMEGDFDKEKLRNLQPNETAIISLNYTIDPVYRGEKGLLYIDQSLFGEKVLDKYKQGKRYGVAVEL